MAEKDLLSAGDPPSFALAVPGNLRMGPCGPAGPPYGRTEHGRSRRVRHSHPRGRKRVKSNFGVSFGDPRGPIEFDGVYAHDKT